MCMTGIQRAFCAEFSMSENFLSPLLICTVGKDSQIHTGLTIPILITILKLCNVHPMELLHFDIFTLRDGPLYQFCNIF